MSRTLRAIKPDRDLQSGRRGQLAARRFRSICATNASTSRLTTTRPDKTTCARCSSRWSESSSGCAGSSSRESSMRSPVKDVSDLRAACASDADEFLSDALTELLQKRSRLIERGH